VLFDKVGADRSDVSAYAPEKYGGGIGPDRTTGLLEPVLRRVVEELETSQPSRVIVHDLHLPGPISFDGGRIARLAPILLGNALAASCASDLTLARRGSHSP
jgi:hypothetical protein